MTNTLAWGAAGLWLLWLVQDLNPRSRYDRLHPAHLIASSWAVMFFLSASQLIQFPPVALEPWLYLGTFASLLVVGASLGAGGSLSANRADGVPANWPATTGADEPAAGFLLPAVMQHLTKIILILGLIGVLAVLTTMISGGRADLSDPTLIRNLDYQLAHDTTWLDRVGYLTLPVSWMALILVFLFAEQLEGPFRWLGVVLVIGLICLGVAMAGRSTMIRLTLVILISTRVRHGMGLRAWPFRWTLFHFAILATAVASAIAYFFFVWTWRAGGQAEFNALQLTASVFHPDASESPPLAWLLRVLPDYARNFALFTPLYFCTVADNFASAYNSVNMEMHYGFWQLQSLAGPAGRLGFPIKPVGQIVGDVTDAFSAAGLSVGQFRSMAQDYILDFGVGGALAAAFLSGLVIGYVYRKFRQGNPYFGLWFTLLATWAVFGAWASATSSNELLQCFYCYLYAAVGTAAAGPAAATGRGLNPVSRKVSQA